MQMNILFKESETAGTRKDGCTDGVMEYCFHTSAFSRKNKFMFLLAGGVMELASHFNC